MCGVLQTLTSHNCLRRSPVALQMPWLLKTIHCAHLVLIIISCRMVHVDISYFGKNIGNQEPASLYHLYPDETWNQGSDDGATGCVATPVWRAGWTPVTAVVRRVAEGTAAMTPDMVRREGRWKTKLEEQCLEPDMIWHDMTWNRASGVSWNRATPSHHPLLDGIFHVFTFLSSILGTPIYIETPLWHDPNLPSITKRCPFRLGMLRVLPIFLTSCICVYFLIVRWYCSAVHRHGTWFKINILWVNIQFSSFTAISREMSWNMSRKKL